MGHASKGCPDTKHEASSGLRDLDRCAWGLGMAYELELGLQLVQQEIESSQSRERTRRTGKRTLIVPHIVQGIITREEGSHAPFVVWDVSPDGVGIWSLWRLAPGEIVKLAFSQPHVAVLSCEVVWCESPRQEDGYRCGLRAQDPTSKTLEALGETVAAQRHRLS